MQEITEKRQSRAAVKKIASGMVEIRADSGTSVLQDGWRVSEKNEKQKFPNANVFH